MSLAPISSIQILEANLPADPAALGEVMGIIDHLRALLNRPAMRWEYQDGVAVAADRFGEETLVGLSWFAEVVGPVWSGRCVALDCACRRTANTAKDRLAQRLLNVGLVDLAGAVRAIELCQDGDQVLARYSLGLPRVDVTG